MTNIGWWQDYPRGNVPDYKSLFCQSSSEVVNQDSKSDFTAQLVGFMANLLVGAPDQAHWILKLAKFDFNNAAGHLVASVPRINSLKHPYISESLHYLTVSTYLCLQQRVRLFRYLHHNRDKSIQVL